MTDHDYVAIECFPIGGVWRVTIRYRSVDERPTVRWRHLGPSYVQVEGDSLQELLEAVAEEVYNWAPLTGDPDDGESPGSALGGDTHSSPRSREAPR
jgi:hypothetical protein